MVRQLKKKDQKWNLYAIATDEQRCDESEGEWRMIQWSFAGEEGKEKIN